MNFLRRIPLFTLFAGISLRIGFLVPVVFEFTERPAPRSRQPSMEFAALATLILSSIACVLVAWLSKITYFTNGNKCIEADTVRGVFQGERYHYTPSGSHFGTSYWRDGQEVGQATIHHDVNASEYAEIEERANFSVLLNDHWR